VESDAFPLKSPTLLSQTSVSLISNGEVVGVKLNTENFHLSGHYLTFCMSNAIRTLASSRFRSDPRAVPEFTVHLSASVNGEPDESKTVSQNLKMRPQAKSKELASLAYHTLNGDPSNRMVPSDSYEFVQRESDTTFRYRRTRDQRELRIHLVE
jgi:hypothetical protein